MELDCAIIVIPKSHGPTQGHRYSPMFLPLSFIILYFIFRGDPFRVNFVKGKVCA